MYAFVESWIPELLGIDHEKYYLSEDVSCSIIFKEDYNKVLRLISRFVSTDRSNEIEITEIASNVNGMRIILMKYWVDESILFSLTDGAIKETSRFVKFMSLPNPRFNFDELKRQLLLLWNESPLPQPAQPNGITENTDILDWLAQPSEEPVIAEEPVAKAPIVVEKPIQISDGEKFLKDIVSAISSEDFEILKTDDGYSVLFSYNVGENVRETLTNLSSKIKKNVIFFNSIHPKISSLLKKRDPVDIYKHTVIFDLSPNHSNNASLFTNETHSGRVPSYSGSICLGEKIKKSYVVRGSKTNDEIKKIVNDYYLSKVEKDIKINEILKNKANSPFFKYDCVFKDTYVGTVFAVKQRCIIYLLFNYSAESYTLLSRCIDEIARRINMDIPYEKLFEIDKKYFDDMESDKIEEYVNFAVSSSKGAYDTAVEKRDTEKYRFNDFMDKAMLAAKAMQYHQDIINAFNSGTYFDEQKEKARSTYLETIDIPKVATIYIDNDTIHVFTKNLYVRDSRSKKYHDIGTFHIIIGMLSPSYDQNNTVRIFNTKYLGMGMNEKFQAPHVWDDGHICHGNAISGMTEAYRNRNLFDLVYQIIIFLETANTSDGAGQCVDSWPEVTEEEALGSGVDSNFMYAPQNEAEKCFDDMLAEALPITIKP